MKPMTEKPAVKKVCPEGKANITVRNFPTSVDEIRKKTGIKDGGDKYLLAYTDLEGKLMVAVCKQLFRSAWGAGTEHKQSPESIHIGWALAFGFALASTRAPTMVDIGPERSDPDLSNKPKTKHLPLNADPSKVQAIKKARLSRASEFISFRRL